MPILYSFLGTPCPLYGANPPKASLSEYKRYDEKYAVPERMRKRRKWDEVGVERL
jgi:hypothetical protein